MLLEKELSHIAEIVLVLAGMAQMRAGQPPGVLERQLAHTAFRRLVSLVTSLRPQALLSDESAERFVRELGLREQSTTEQGCSRAQGAEVAADARFPQPEYLDLASLDGPHACPWEDGSSPRSTSSGSANEGDNELLDVAASSRDSELEILPFDHYHGNIEGYRKQLGRAAQQYFARISNCVSTQSPGVQATAYVNQPMACQMCQIVTRDTATVLVCDSCELAYHLSCLKSFKARGLSEVDGEVDWDCPKCVVKHGGRPPASVYGILPI